MTPEQRSAWFTYHPPTEITTPRYATIRVAEEEARYAVTVSTPVDSADPNHVRHDNINDGLACFADIVDQLCPDGYDKDRAIVSIRRARMAANEAVVSPKDAGRLTALALTALQEARWWANSAIACGGV